MGVVFYGLSPPPSVLPGLPRPAAGVYSFEGPAAKAVSAYLRLILHYEVTEVDPPSVGAPPFRSLFAPPAYLGILRAGNQRLRSDRLLRRTTAITAITAASDLPPSPPSGETKSPGPSFSSDEDSSACGLRGQFLETEHPGGLDEFATPASSLRFKLPPRRPDHHLGRIPRGTSGIASGGSLPVQSAP